MIDRYALAVEHSNSMGGAMSPEDILDLWKRHPAYAPGGPLWTSPHVTDNLDAKYPCSWSDYLFTLLLGGVVTAVLSYCDVPIWIVAFMVHAFTCRWFFDTRK